MSSIATTSTATPGQISPRLRAFALGLGLTLLLAVLLASGIAVAIGVVNSGRVLPNVSVAGISLGGLDRESAQARLEAQLPHLDEGVATLSVGSQQFPVSYSEAGRRYDVAAMADAAYASGRSEGVGLVVVRLRDWLIGSSLPTLVHAYDEDAMDAIASRVGAAAAVTPQDASVQADARGHFAVRPARPGVQVIAGGVRQTLGAALANETMGDQVIQVPSTVIEPAVATEAAQAAADAANRIAAGGLSLRAVKDRFRLSQRQVAAMITFAAQPSGAIETSLDGEKVKSAVTRLARKINRPVRDASYAWGAEITVIPSVEGRQVDRVATVKAVTNALEERAAGSTGAAGSPVRLAVAVTAPKLTTEEAQASVPRLVRIGTWTTYYIPGISNGYGANISIPAQTLNGLVVAPGGTLDFWRDIGPVTFARGYTYGGAIINGKSEETGALAGGICSTSTTLFNAALRAGLQMGERMNHFYYISRYPVGLDATVFQDVGGVTNMTWTNDTAYPVIIRSYTAYGIVRFDLYSVPTGRTVTLTTPIITNRVPARLYAGFDAVVYRYVRDTKGNLIHSDRYFSHYHAVNS